MAATNNINDNSAIPASTHTDIIKPKLSMMDDDSKYVPIHKIDESWTIEELVEKYPFSSDWRAFFDENIDAIITLSEAIDKAEKQYGYKSYPRRCEMFSIFTVIDSPKKIKVVLIGQDPYPSMLNTGEPRAVGMSFSARRYDVVPNSLINVYKELARCYPDFVKPNHGDLSSWAHQGVFLLNKALTVRPDKPNEHIKLWASFLVQLVKYIIRMNPKVCFMLWGKEAQKLESELDKIKVFTAAHPSGMNTSSIKFEGCNNFLMVNDYLQSIGQNIIRWNVY